MQVVAAAEPATELAAEVVAGSGNVLPEQVKS